MVRCFHLSCIYSQKGNCWVITVTLYLTSCDATRLLFKEATLFCTLTSNLCRLQFSHPCQHLLLSTYFIHFCEREVVTVLLICISLSAYEIEDLFTGCLAVCLSSLENYLFRSIPCPFFTWVICPFNGF